MAQINKPTDYFNTVLYTGDGTSSNAITGVGFQPDWVWIKVRSTTGGHRLVDAVRGATKFLVANATNAEGTDATQVASLDSDGFTVGSDSATNLNSATFASWNWLASNTTASNTDGSITSTVSANTTSGFSIVSYTGNATNPSTIGHGLGVAPKIVIVKRRNNADGWQVYVDGLSSVNHYLRLDTTGAEASDSTRFGAAPTTSVFTVGNANGTNASGDTYIAYCFAEKKGFSKFGSYTGNGSTDGSFCYLGMKPKFIMIKRTNGIGDWVIYDGVKEPFNVIDTYLEANSSNADTTLSVRELDILSNGFKVRGTNTSINDAGSSYIYMAFAESPLVGTNNIPAVAR